MSGRLSKYQNFFPMRFDRTNGNDYHVQLCNIDENEPRSESRTNNTCNDFRMKKNKILKRYRIQFVYKHYTAVADNHKSYCSPLVRVIMLYYTVRCTIIRKIVIK